MHTGKGTKHKSLNCVLDYLLSYRALITVVALFATIGTWAYMRGGQTILPRVPFYLTGACMTFGICVVARKYQINTSLFEEEKPTPPIQRRLIETFTLIAIGGTCYVSLALLLYCAWFKGDDYVFFHDGGITERLKIWWQSYISWVSRSGEFVAHLLGISKNRWQVFTLVPLLVVLSPVFFFNLVSNSKQSLCSKEGRYFYVLCISLLLLSTKMDAWRIFYCFAASMNYLFPSIAAVLLLSFYNQKRWSGTGESSSAVATGRNLAIFGLGIYVCWGGESLSLIVLSLLIIWFAYRMIKHQPIPVYCWLGCIGSVIGTTLLFASPALKSRSMIDAKARALDIQGMTAEQIHHFVSNLSWDQVNLLKGSSGVIILNGIPLWQHVHFLPYLLERYIQCSMYILSALLIFTILTLLSHQQSRVNLIVIAGSLAVSLFGACAYLYSCIPTPMSFAPATISLIGAIAYIYWNSSIAFTKMKLVVIIAFATALYHLIPAGIEGWQYKPYEKNRFKEIVRQKALGKQDIVLPPAYPSLPHDYLGLIKRSDLKFSPDEYPNNLAPYVLQVKSISQLPCK